MSTFTEYAATRGYILHEVTDAFGDTARCMERVIGDRIWMCDYPDKDPSPEMWATIIDLWDRDLAEKSA